MKLLYDKKFKGTLKLFNKDDQIYNIININKPSEAFKIFKSYLEAQCNSDTKMQYEQTFEIDKSKPYFIDISDKDLFIANDIERKNDTRYEYVSMIFYFARTKTNVEKYKCTLIIDTEYIEQSRMEFYKYKSYEDISKLPIMF